MEKVESTRAAALLQAQQKADELFRAVETHGLIRPNVLESKLNQDIYDLAKQEFPPTGTNASYAPDVIRLPRTMKTLRTSRSAKTIFCFST
jgi:hypothetical protein